MLLSTFYFLFSTVLADLPPGQPITFDTLNQIIGRIARFIIILGPILAVIFIVWGGITYMAAGSDTTKVDEARARIKNGIIGAVVVLGVGVIINTIAGVISGYFFCQVQFVGVCFY